MSTFTFNAAIPQPGDNPSVSQGQLLQNFTSLGAASSWTTQDHFGFGTGTDGWHKQINLPSNGTLGTMTLLQSGMVTAPGVASSANSQLFYKNANATVPLSFIKAFATVDQNGNIIASQSYNVSSISHPSTGNYTITLTTGACTTTNYAVIVSSTVNPSSDVRTVINYSVSSATSFALRVAKADQNGLSVDALFSFIIVQA